MACKPLKAVMGGQPFPTSNSKIILVDARIPQSLRKEPGEVFSYKLTTIEESKGSLIQHGTAPNYQGGKITLCTCMHHHRTWPRIDIGTWIAGFSDNASGNKLFYLMRVEHTVYSFDAMWRSHFIANLAAKSGSRDIFGDLYEPVSMKTSANPYNPAFYRHPISGHKHLARVAWQHDIKFRHWSTRKPHKLLVGEPGKSFLWRHSRYSYKKPPHPRFRFHETVTDFLKELK